LRPPSPSQVCPNSKQDMRRETQNDVHLRMLQLLVTPQTHLPTACRRHLDLPAPLYIVLGSHISQPKDQNKQETLASIPEKVDRFRSSRGCKPTTPCMLLGDRHRGFMMASWLQAVLLVLRPAPGPGRLFCLSGLSVQPCVVGYVPACLPRHGAAQSAMPTCSSLTSRRSGA
jgi:hypothetical protein